MASNTELVLGVLAPVFRLFAFTLAGFALFKIRWVRQVALKPFVWTVLNVVMPLYFVHSLPERWSAAADTGFVWFAVFFVAYLVYVGLQYGVAKLLINRAPLMHTEYPSEFLVVFSMHNAGYIPIPIIAVLAPAVVLAYMSSYLLAFLILFFTVAVWIIQSAAGRQTRFRANGPMIGIVVGFLVAVSGIYPGLPAWIQAPFRGAAFVALDGIMMVLGAILASIPTEAIRWRREFGGYILYKMFLFPIIVVGLMLLIPLRAVPPDVAAGIKLAFVLEAVVPPATNILVVTRAYGNDEQVEFAGSAIVFTYLAGLVVIPFFLVVSRILFG